MMVRVPGLLDSDAVARCRVLLEDAPWADGRITAGTQSARAKHNLQLRPTATRRARPAPWCWPARAHACSLAALPSQPPPLDQPY
jgi:PKHD-type hydroxylase